MECKIKRQVDASLILIIIVLIILQPGFEISFAFRVNF